MKLWAVENGITNGVDASHFSPARNCNRAQVVTFLYKAYHETQHRLPARKGRGLFCAKRTGLTLRSARSDLKKAWFSGISDSKGRRSSSITVLFASHYSSLDKRIYIIRCDR